MEIRMINFWIVIIVSCVLNKETYFKKKLKKSTKKRGRPKSSGSKIQEGETPKKKLKTLASGNRSGYRGAGMKGSSGYFMKGKAVEGLGTI
jgi:hypothetical protein